MSTPAPARSFRWQSGLVRAAKLLLLVIVGWGIHRTVLAALEQLDQHPWQWRPGWLSLAGGIYLVGVLPAGWYWHWTMRRLGNRPRLLRSLAAYYVGHLGKYVPGKGMVVVLRAGLVRGSGVDTRLAAAAVFYETLTTMAAGGALAALLMVTWLDVRGEVTLLSVGLALALVIPTIPPVARRLIARLTPRGERALVADAISLEGTTRLVGWGVSVLVWVVLGLSLEAALLAADADLVDPLAELPLCTAAVALAVVAGFLSFVPGGAVVREAVLLELLAPRYGAAPAVVGAVLLRLAWLGAELATAAGIWIASLRDRRKLGGAHPGADDRNG
ncbi:MAG: flippase-like domain-containing protein [Planctomycetaceae bacterium]|nr:flippase-like domain-containing protein [Planctomycetaceae bacterium]